LIAHLDAAQPTAEPAHTLHNHQQLHLDLRRGRAVVFGCKAGAGNQEKLHSGEGQLDGDSR